MTRSHLAVLALTFSVGIGAILLFPVWMRSGEVFVDLEGPRAREAASPADRTEEKELRFCVATMWSPQEAFARYRRLAELLGRRAGMSQTFVIPTDYREARRALQEGAVDVALVCTGTLVNLPARSSVEVLAMPRFREGLEYRGLLVVPAASPVTSPEELAGRSLALTDRESLTGCIVPCTYFRDVAGDLPNFFGSVVFTGSHDLSIEAAAAGRVDAAAVMEPVYRALCRESQRIREQTRIIWRSERLGPPPVLVPRGLPVRTKSTLRRIFLALHQSPEGREVLADLEIERFEEARPETYTSARKMAERFEATGGCPWR